MYLAGGITSEDSKTMSHLKKGGPAGQSDLGGGARKALNAGAVSLVASGRGAEERGSLQAVFWGLLCLLVK